ncbi:MAG: SusC/RagA family TonB-linked outer membrane protein [Bacteroidia bacterium]
MKRTSTLLNLSLFLLLLFATSVKAQQTVSGTVKDEKGETLIGVSVVVKGTAIGTVTNVDGMYSIKMPASSGKLIFSYVGYSTQEKVVAAGTTSFDVVLSEKATKLDEAVVSGLATSVKRSNAANAISQISSRDLTGTTIQSTVDGAMYGKVAGANLSSNGGSPGGGMSVKLRGINSISGNGQPLYVVDGVYYDNSAIAAGLNAVSKAANQGSAANQDNPSSRIADLNPEDIEKIEVLKGASAAAIYGSRAGSGVIIITTKKGRNSGGKPQVSLSQSIGMQTQLRKLGQRNWTADTAFKFLGQNGLDVYNANGGVTHDYEKELYGNKGMMYTTNVGVSGGSENSAYYAGFSRIDEEGIVKHTGYEKSSLRLNLDQRIFKFMDLSISSNYVSSSADRGFFGNDNTSTTMGVSFVSTPSFANILPDALGNYPDNPFAPSNFLQTRDLITNNEKVNRFTSGISLTTRLITQEKQSLQLILKDGIDYYNLETKAVFPTTLQFEANGKGTSGLVALGSNNNKNNNLSAFLVHAYYAPNNLIFRTQAGVTQEKFDANNVLSTATHLIGSQTNIDQAGSIQGEQTRIKQIDKGFFAQEEVNFHDLIVASLGIRADKSSRNGDPDKLYSYPKASLAINVSEFDFWKKNPEAIFNTLKARVAYGEAGNFAVFGSTYSPLVPVVSNGSTGSLIGLQRGNSTIGPERQQELEGGIDLGLLKNKLLFDFTLYKKTNRDFFYPVQIATSTGYSTFMTNAGDLENTGVEIGLDYTPFQKKDFSWNTHFAWWKNKSEITKLNIPAFNFGGFGKTLGTYRLEEGKSATQIVGIGPAGQADPSTGLVVWGDAEPDFQLSWTNTLTYKAFEFSFLLHWKKGGDNINLTTLLADLSGNSPDFDDKDLDPSGNLSNGNYRLSQLGTSASVFIEDASYLRVREIGLAYNMPRKWFRNVCGIKVQLSARNLINIFKYNSYDPEVSNFGVNSISSNVEVTPYPSAKSYFLNVGITF